MDSLSDLIPFAIAAAYLFARFARRKKPETARSAPVVRVQRASTAGPTPFEQLVARLEAASQPAGPPVAPAPASVRRESDMAANERAARAATKARTEAATAFHSARRPASGAAAHVGMSAQHGFEHEADDFDLEARGFDHEQKDFEHDRHGFESANPYSEEALEQARDGDLRPTSPVRLDYDPHARPAAPPAARPASVADRLRSPESLRDAFVLSTILARRPRRLLR